MTRREVCVYMRNGGHGPPLQSVEQLRFLRSGRFRAAVAAREFLHSPRGVDELLFARKKRMASGADADLDPLLGRSRVIDSSAGTGNICLGILRMNVRFHEKIERSIYRGIAFAQTEMPCREGAAHGRQSLGPWISGPVITALQSAPPRSRVAPGSDRR